MHWNKTSNQKRNILWIMWISLLICFISIGCVAGSLSIRQPAHAGDLTLSTGKYLERRTSIGGRIKFGVMAVSPDGRNAYCVEAGKVEEPRYSSAQRVQDSNAIRRIAWLADHYQNENDAVTHAAISVLVRQHLESGNHKLWAQRKVWLFEHYPQVPIRVDQLWQEAGNNLAQVARARVHYEEGKRTGTLTAQVLDEAQHSIAGVAYKVTLQGPAVFDANNTQQYQGVSVVGGEPLSWHATGDGKVTAALEFAYPTLERLDSSQDLVRYGTLEFEASEPVSFEVEKTFQPTLTTQATTHVVDPGDLVRDTVTSGVVAGQDWKAGIPVFAQGYYFAGKSIEQLDQQIQPNSDEDGKAFTERLAKQGYRPVAYAATQFTAPNQTQEVIALQTMPSNADKSDASVPQYHAKLGDSIGTWVWIIDKSAQLEDSKQWVRGNYVSNYMEKVESLSTREILHIDSTVTEHTAHLGSTLSDTITIEGFPDDHGKFKGDPQAGLEADTEYVTVQLYWAGDSKDSARNKDYKPTTATVPAQDDHHKLVGQWQYRARNGMIRVGNGSKDIHGKPVHIEAIVPGYYVFVLSFKGDSRVQPASSAYDNAWECVWVPDTPEPELEQVSLTTAVNAEQVQTGDEVYDTAIMTGTVPQGAYVTFSAYQSARGGEPLLDEYKVVLPDTSNEIMAASKPEKTVKSAQQQVYAKDGRLMVESKRLKAHKLGKIYWKATMWSADGEVLASHPLGADHEVTTVSEPPEPPTTPPDTPNPPELAHTGVSVGTMAVGVILIAVCGIAGFSLLRVQRMRHE